jgi:hypothetical protein
METCVPFAFAGKPSVLSSTVDEHKLLWTWSTEDDVTNSADVFSGVSKTNATEIPSFMAVLERVFNDNFYVVSKKES